MKIQVRSTITGESLGQYKVEWMEGDYIIKSPGKFEGESIKTPIIWDYVLNGFSQLTPIKTNRGENLQVERVQTDKKSTFGEKTFYLTESNQGFVSLLDSDKFEEVV